MVGDKIAHIPVFDGHVWHKVISHTGYWMNTYIHTYRHREMLKDIWSMMEMNRAIFRAYFSLT